MLPGQRLARVLPPALRVVYSRNGVGDEEICYSALPFPTGIATQVAVVVDPATKTIALYQDGALLSEPQEPVTTQV